MLNVQESVAQAKREIGSVFGTENISDILLEEVDFDEVNSNWLISVSFLRKQLAAAKQKTNFEKMAIPMLDLNSLERGIETRVFKRVHIRAEDGKLIRISSIETGLAA